MLQAALKRVSKRKKEEAISYISNQSYSVLHLSQSILAQTLVRQPIHQQVNYSQQLSMSQQGGHTANAEDDSTEAVIQTETGAKNKRPAKTPKSDPVAEAAAEQKNVRSRITTTSKTIYAYMVQRKSRGSIKAFLTELLQLKQRAMELNDFLGKVKAIDPKKVEKQQSDHLTYIGIIADVEEKVEEHLASRADEATTVAGSVKSLKKTTTISHPQKLLPKVPLQTEIQSVTKNPLTRKPSSFGTAHSLFPFERQEEANEEEDDEDDDAMGEEEEEAADMVLGDDDEIAATLRDLRLIQQQFETAEEEVVQPRQDPRTKKRINDWMANQPATDDPAPDDWIDTYVNGSSPPVIHKRNKDDSSLRARLEVFTGQSLDWFMWISKFHSLVHLTNKTPDEKLAILHSHLAGSARKRINALAGGELAYKQALLRLKQAYGNRDVMVCAIETALNELKVPVNNPNCLQEYADSARSLLFDLSRVGGPGSNKIIDSIANKLVLEDRLAWNTEKRTLLLLGSHPLNVFGEWLCDRALAYQTPDSIAAAQRAEAQGSSNQNAAARNQTQQRHQNQQSRPSGNRHVRVHHG